MQKLISISHKFVPFHFQEYLSAKYGEKLHICIILRTKLKHTSNFKLIGATYRSLGVVKKDIDNRCQLWCISSFMIYGDVVA